MAAMLKQPDFLLFASDADLIALWGAGFLLLALLALAGDRRRLRRERMDRLDRVGWVPWTPLFLACAVIGGGLLAVALPQALFGH